MRVIAGTARSLKLITPAGLNVRPTTDRIKETLFNIINPYIYGCNFLDLFAGSGAIGIEALSRGADLSVFVDSSRESLTCIKANLEHTGFTNKAEVIASDCLAAIERLTRSGKKFDIIFMDPPYDKELEKKILTGLDKADILADDGIIIVEASSGTQFDYITDTDFKVYREKNYGSNKHVFLCQK